MENYSVEQYSDFEWFTRNYKSLFEQYGNCYLAIKGCEVLGNYSSYANAVKETKKDHEIGTFIVQKCDGNESAFTSYNVTSYSFRR